MLLAELLARDDVPQDLKATIQKAVREEHAAHRQTIEALRLTQFSLDRAVIPTLWITRKGRFRYINEAACEVLGYSKDELMEMTVDDIDPSFSPELRAAHWEEIKQIGAVTFETWCLRKDASAFPAEIRTNYLAFGGEEYEVAFLLDLTERKRLEEELRALSRQDGLTELPNRRAFEEQLDQEWRRAIRSRSPLSLLMADIDHFKQYNDSLGHLAGDQCLRQVANLLREAFLRATDFPSRWGGEEFAVILAETDPEEALAVAERLRRRVEEAGLSREPLPGVVTLSVGVATIRHPTDLTLSDLKATADEALYASKKAGRNRVTAAPE